MNPDKINRWLTLCANVGVLIGLAFLIAEIEQTSRISEFETESQLADSFNSINDVILENSELREVLLKADSQSSFSPDDKQLINAFVRKQVNIWRATQTAYENGFIDNNSYDALFLREIPRVMASRPGLVPYFAQLIGYPNSVPDTVLGDFMSSIIAKSEAENTE